MKRSAYLVLEDGTVHEGRALGKIGTSTGEIVFNTASAGYQEILTDPSYRGQIVCMAFPMVGNYGFHELDSESSDVVVAGFAVSDASASLEQYLMDYDIVGINGIDTRSVVRHVRDRGAMRAAVSSIESPENLVALARSSRSMAGADLVSEIKAAKNVVNPQGRIPVAVLDCGVKLGIIDALAERDCRVSIFPASTKAAEILADKPTGLVLGNGPGDPAALPEIVAEVKAMLGRVPIFGICLGHQLLALAAGAKTYKLPFGHRGANHPVINLETGSVAITSQNHGFAVDESSLPDSIVPTERNLYDGTNEGIAVPAHRAFSVQYHPEARPGPLESAERFDRFLRTIQNS